MHGWVRRLAVAAVLAVAVIPGYATAAPAVPATAIATRDTSPTSEAAAASAEARSLRRDVAALLQQYIDEYGSRFTETELQRLRGYKANADRHLATVVLTTNRLTYLTARRAPRTQVKASVARATTTWARAKSTAESSWEDARRIMEPKLSLREKIGAAHDYNRMMARFDELGDRIRSVAP